MNKNHSFLLLFTGILLFSFRPLLVRANDFLEHEEHYTVMATGEGKIHLKLPVYSRGGYNYFIKDNSYISSYVYFVADGTSDKVSIFRYRGEMDSDGPSADDDQSRGYAWLRSSGDAGIIEVTNTSAGSNQQHPNDGSEHRYSVSKAREYDNDQDYVTWLEIDWYPPALLDSVTFSIGTHVRISTRFQDDDESNYEKDWVLKTGLTGASNIIDAQLFDPYFYAVNEKGIAGYGYAAVPYSLFYEPIDYQTSFDSTHVKTSQRSDNVYIATSDTVRPGFNMTFHFYLDKSVGTERTQTTQSVTIPAYHRLYNLRVSEELDSTDTYTGNSVLEWEVKHPDLADLVDNDYFEVQRALKSDFSDAQTIRLEPMRKGAEYSTYRYSDASRSTWTGHASTSDGSDRVQTVVNNYLLSNGKGTPLATLNLTLTADSLHGPGVPVYYRVRRASSSIWGWNHEFAQHVELTKHNFLAPLSETQPQYSLDPEYATNRKVHFEIRLYNQEVHYDVPSYESCSFGYSVLERDEQVPHIDDTIAARMAAVASHLKDSMYQQLKHELEQVKGRCMWDRTARLILVRSSEEHPDVKTELTIPQDSIEHQPDGSWLARFSDVASNACTHYTYAVRIDQSSSDLHVQDSASLEPKVISGPSLYFDEAAQIVSFTATQGSAETHFKRGVMLNWSPSSNAVDTYLLLRQSVNSTASPDTVYTGPDITYFDLSAVPNEHYEYTVVALYECNGRHSENSASVEGWRTPYGEISGSIKMPDNTGLPGVTVALQDSDGTVVRTLTTGPDGEYLFDSLEYIHTVLSPTQDVEIHYAYASGCPDPAPITQIRLTDKDGHLLQDWTNMPAGIYQMEIGTTVEVQCSHEELTNSGEIRSCVIGGNNAVVKCYTSTYMGPQLKILMKYYLDYADDGSRKELHPGIREFVVIPTSTHGQFSYNNTSAGTASITLSADNAVAGGIDFTNTNSVRLSGRALYSNSTVPVSGAMFRLSGDTVLRNGHPITTGTDGNFELTLTNGQPYTLQIFKPGHRFELDGYFQMEEGVDTFSLDKALDGIRFYDQTKVRLVGRVAGGIDQRDLPAAFGKGKNNLGDDLTLVLQVEGDNTAQLVHDPYDLSRDTVQQTIEHMVFSNGQEARVVGQTHTLFEKKRITIHPDSVTGEFAVDLFPVKYKVVQATAKGYASLFASGQGNETFDLTQAPLTSFDPVIENDSVHYNAVYNRIYRTPVQVALTQYLYGLEHKGLGEESLNATGMNLNASHKVKLYKENADRTIEYLLGYPVFMSNRKYQFCASAYEDYYYNNDHSGTLDRVPERGGQVTIHNGLLSTVNSQTYELNHLGQNNDIWLEADYPDTEYSGTSALRTIGTVLNMEGASVETANYQAFVIGDRVNERELQSTEADIHILDIIRDPGGSRSSAWIENGTTYNFGYTETYDAQFGLELMPEYGGTVSRDIGVYSGSQVAGSYVGSTFSTGKTFSFTIPLVASYSWGFEYNYSLTTTERISTSSGTTPLDIGSNADVFIGTTMSQLTGKAKSISLINDSLFAARQPAIRAGMMKVLAEGVDSTGAGYHLVTGEKVVMGSTISNTFAYSQIYILNTVIPKLVLERYNLLMQFDSEAAAQAYADASDDVVYWYTDSTLVINLQDTLKAGEYKMIVPTGSQKAYPDRVGALEQMIKSWISVLYYNEKEKVKARESGMKVGTYSVNHGNSLSHSDSYSSSFNYNSLPIGSAFAKSGEGILTDIASSSLSSLLNSLGESFGSELNIIGELFGNFKDLWADQDSKEANASAFETVTAESKWSLKYNPVIDFTPSNRDSKTGTKNKSTGFSIEPDTHGDITVSVYRASLDSVWKDITQEVREKVDIDNLDDYLFGGYVFFTEAGATYCVHEDEEKTRFYQPGTLINSPTLFIAKPELSISTYEQANIPADQRAQFRIEIRNGGQRPYGTAAIGSTFGLSLIGASNPNGAKVYLNGAPLMTPIYFYLLPGEVASQIIEVERGTVDDYENMELYLELADCPKTFTSLKFSVHFMPESSPVSIESPRQNWVMNTLSPKDSVGYYLPIDISGFNVRHKNFDHIEFQYKLATESDEKWVNQCSFFADDSLYQLASGNKAMIENGRITPFRFYGERDPMEQKYDLRAVSFCRHGSGFVSKSSPIISGTKDTRPPVVFGEPEPANSILGVGDHLRLRFNEAIAGNYLDEDNNFQITGVTNQTGISAATALHFDGNGIAYTRTKRDLRDRSFTIDMMIRPNNATNRTKDMILFETGTDDYKLQMILTADNRLRMVDVVGNSLLGKTSTQLEPILSFTRVLAVYDKETQLISFYVGNTDVTDNIVGDSFSGGNTNSAYFRFGENYEGDMLETRIWTKALTLEEITATADRSLTGYEQELLAYYRMDEGKGETVSDKAHGATLYLDGCSWNKQKGFSLRFDGTQTAQLDGNKLSRSDIYDETLLFRFKAESDGTLFSAGRQEAGDSIEAKGTLIAIENGNIVLRSGANEQIANGQMVDGTWHHLVLTISRTYNHAALFLDGELYLSLDANRIEGITGAMYLGGNGFKGNIDEFAIFEQALPKTLVEIYKDIAFTGDEMGLMAYLPFEEQFLNASGVLELRFSVNDRRIIRNPETGEVIDKVVPLVISDQPADISDLASEENAPVKANGLLNKLYFNWAFNHDELMINILNRDYEVNKQSIYVTVRDVEDMNGNPMVSPVTWTAFVDRNSLKWSAYELSVKEKDGEEKDVQIINLSGKRHTYSIESLPEWLTVNLPSGAIDPMGQQTVTLTFNPQIPVGEYSDIIYLTDEDGLNEPLRVVYEVQAVPPYDEVDKGKYPLNMSVCGQVRISTEDGSWIYDTDSRDVVYAIYRNECVGAANVTVNTLSNTAEVYLTVMGNDGMARKELSFQLWQARTGKLLNLTPSLKILFSHGAVYGCGTTEPVVFTTSASGMQTIELQPGWNWVSFNLNLQPSTASIVKVLSANQPWTAGDIIKNPATQHFVSYSAERDAFVGDFSYLRYIYTYMVYSAHANTMRVNGNRLPADSMHVSVRGDGRWSPMPCLLNATTPVTVALADYYEQASPGDMIKAHDRFAYFSEDKQWVGDLTALRPGEGYFFRRMAPGNADIRFFDDDQTKKYENELKGKQDNGQLGKHENNMTMIATIENDGMSRSQSELNDGMMIRVFVGDELVGVAEPLQISNDKWQMTNGEALYFITISSDKIGAPLRFVTEDGSDLTPSLLGKAWEEASIIYSPDTHFGSLKAPVRLHIGETRTYKVIENNHVIIIRNNEKYDITGKKL